MGTYLVRMPFTGVASAEIQAESEEDALAKFHNEATFPNLVRTIATDVEVDDIGFAEKIVGGNVFYGVLNEYDIEEI